MGNLSYLIPREKRNSFNFYEVNLLLENNFKIDIAIEDSDILVLNTRRRFHNRHSNYICTIEFKTVYKENKIIPYLTMDYGEEYSYRHKIINLILEEYSCIFLDESETDVNDDLILTYFN